jgi:hypothetical protein
MERSAETGPVRRSARTLYAAAQHAPDGQILVPRRRFQGIVGDFAAESVGFRRVGTNIVHCVQLFARPQLKRAREKQKAPGPRRLMSETYRSGSH